MDTTIPLAPPDPERKCSVNRLPQLIQTPSGLAFLELQGTFKLPETEGQERTPIGTIHFPNYKPGQDEGDTSWMKKVYMYVDRGMRLMGQVKKLETPVAVVRRSQRAEKAGEALEVVEILKYKLLFSDRPEPIGSNEQPYGNCIADST